MTDGGDKPDKPDPFAPLPLATLPPVRGRDESGPTQKATPKATKLGPAGGQDLSAGQASSGGQVWETPAGESGSDSAQSGANQAWTEAPAGSTTQAWAEAPQAVATEAPLLPQTYNEDELRDAVGATPRIEPKKKKKAAPPPVDDDDDDGDGGGKKMSRKTLFVAAASIVMGGGIAALVLLGKVNSARYYIACEEDQVVVEQGRSFPPWGSSSLDGAEWKALKIPPESACHPRETEDRAELAGWYLKMLTDFADKQLSAREITKVDDAEAALKQALLVTRALRTDDDAKNARGDIDRLLGDVVYWRASARLKGASDALTDAAKQFDAAATARPQHFKDAAEWAKYTRTVIDQLRAGPGGIPAATFPPTPPSERPTAPTGVALPIEPEGSGAGTAEPPPPAPDAGMPTGGVLL